MIFPKPYHYLFIHSFFMKYVLMLLLIAAFANGDGYAQKAVVDKQRTREEIRQMEKSFQDYLLQHGAEAAFHHYAADDAVIKREGDSLIAGKAAIKNYYSNPAYKNATATWSPDFIDVSDDGTLAYTYGKYKWTTKDTSGKATTYEGVFHTVWKRMKDGSWKYVWD